MDTTIYRVIGKRGSGMSRVEWTFTPDDNEHTCHVVARVYGSSGVEPLTISERRLLAETAATAAARYLAGHPDRTVVRYERKAYH